MTFENFLPSTASSRRLPGFGWVRAGTAIAAIGFAAVSLAQYFIRDAITLFVVIDLVVALACAVAFWLFPRWPRAAALFVIGTIWLELTLTLYDSAAPEVSSMLVYPMLILTLALLESERVAIGAALLTGAAIPLAVFSGRRAQHITTDKATVVVSLVVVEIVLVCAGMFGRVLLASFRQLLDHSESLRSRYKRLFEDMPDGLLETDPAGRIVEANAAVERLLHTRRNELLGQMLSDVQAARKIGPALVPRDIRPGLPALLEAGHQRLEVTAGTPPDAAGSALLVVRDVTARHHLNERQSRVQRLESVGQLAGGIAHEFNNLLTAIGGNAGLLKTHADGDVQKFAGQILLAQQRAAGLTRQMLAFARHDFQQTEIVSLARELMEWGGLLRHLMGDHCQLDIKGEGSAWVEVDPVQLEQILMHLLNNARDATAPSGLVELRYGCLGRTEAVRLGSTLEAPAQVMIEVEDRGRGMTPEVKSRLFEPFFTTKPTGQGTGLGLAAVHGLVMQNHGAIEIVTEAGRGTTVRVFFPEVDAGSRPASGSPVPKAADVHRHILLVDSDLTSNRTAIFALERAGYQVTVVDNGFDAVKFFRQTGGISLLIASATLPVLPGRELADRLRKLAPALPVLYLSGRFEVPAGWPADEKNFPLLVKPFRAEELLQRVAGLLPSARKE